MVQQEVVTYKRGPNIWRLLGQLRIFLKYKHSDYIWAKFGKIRLLFIPESGHTGGIHNIQQSKLCREEVSNFSYSILC